ncbi:MATE family efflux transporter [Proteobacteria bacterium 005FR1]|nr:MATE family efflux transporter [Proteobacteria bacterium 005FR1]
MTAVQKQSAWSLIKEALAGSSTIDYTQGSIARATFLLAVPMILEMAMESVFAIVDIFFVAQLGMEAVATVGLTEAVITLLYAVAIGLSMGTTALVARRFGEGNREAAAAAGAQALLLGAVVATVVGIVGITYAEDILRLMGADAATLDIGQGYTTIMLGGSFTILFLFLNNAIFRGAGDASIAMRSLWLANGINIVLDPCLIYGWGPFPEMGVTGAAVATNIGRGVGVLYQLYHLSAGSGRIHIAASGLRLQTGVMATLLKTSMGGIAQFLIATASWVLLVRIVSLYGPVAVAGYTIAIRIILFSFLPAWGLSNAVATLVGQNLGAKKPERAAQTVWQVSKYTVVYIASVALLFMAMPATLIANFTPDTGVIEYGAMCLRILSYGFVFWALGMVTIQAFNGAGDTMTPTWINLFCFWVVQIPLAYLLATQTGLQSSGVFWATVVADTLTAVIGVMVFMRGGWKSKVV